VCSHQCDGWQTTRTVSFVGRTDIQIPMRSAKPATAARPLPEVARNKHRGDIDGEWATMKKATATKAAVKKTPAKKAPAKKAATKAAAKTPHETAAKKVAGKAARKTEKSADTTAAKEVGSHSGSGEKNSAGGLTAAGRRAFHEREGANLKPGVGKPETEMTPEEMKRKGSWAARFYGRKSLPPLVDKRERAGAAGAVSEDEFGLTCFGCASGSLTKSPL